MKLSLSQKIASLFAEKSKTASVENKLQKPPQEQSEKWELYWSDMGGKPAVTVYDEGISDKLNSLSLPKAIKVKLHLKSVRENGLPTSEEGERLLEIGPIIENAISDNGGIFVGRVTTNSVRWNIGFVPESTEVVEQALRQKSIENDFQYEVFVHTDDNKSAYWDYLYPTPNDRQVIEDMKVLRALRENGDNPEVERRVDHWSFFEVEEQAILFKKWAESEGYEIAGEVERIDNSSNQMPWRVRFHHTCSVILNDITHHTIKLSNQTQELGGTYDGWETFAAQ